MPALGGSRSAAAGRLQLVAQVPDGHRVRGGGARRAQGRGGGEPEASGQRSGRRPHPCRRQIDFRLGRCHGQEQRAALPAGRRRFKYELEARDDPVRPVGLRIRHACHRVQQRAVGLHRRAHDAAAHRQEHPARPAAGRRGCARSAAGHRHGQAQGFLGLEPSSSASRVLAASRGCVAWPHRNVALVVVGLDPASQVLLGSERACRVQRPGRVSTVFYGEGGSPGVVSAVSFLGVDRHSLSRDKTDARS